MAAPGGAHSWDDQLDYLTARNPQAAPDLGDDLTLAVRRLATTRIAADRAGSE